MSDTGVQLGLKSPLPFFENRKKCSNFGRKGPNCAHLWVEWFIQNLVLRVSRRKHSQHFFLQGLFSGVFDKLCSCFSESQASMYEFNNLTNLCCFWLRKGDAWNRWQEHLTRSLCFLGKSWIWQDSPLRSWVYFCPRIRWLFYTCSLKISTSQLNNCYH